MYWNCSCICLNYLCTQTCRLWLSFLFGYNTKFISFAGWFSMKKPSLWVCFTINCYWQTEMSGLPSRWEEQQIRPLLVPFFLLHMWQEMCVSLYQLCLFSNVELYWGTFSRTNFMGTKNSTNVAHGLWNLLRLANFSGPNFNFIINLLKLK